MGKSRKKARYDKDGIDYIAVARQLDADCYGSDEDELDVNRLGLSAHSKEIAKF